MRFLVPLSLCGCGSFTSGYRQTIRAPVGKSFTRATGAVPMLAQDTHRLHRVDAVGPSTVGDDLTALGDFCQASLQLRDRNRERTRYVAGEIFVQWPHVDHRDVSP